MPILNQQSINNFLQYDFLDACLSFQVRDAPFHVNFDFLKSFESVFVATVVFFTKVEFNWIDMNHFPPQPILFKQRMSCCNRTICHPLFLKMGLFLEIAVTRLPRKMEPCSVIRRVTREATLSERPTNHYSSFRARCEVGWWNGATKPTKYSIVYIAFFFSSLHNFGSLQLLVMNESGFKFKDMHATSIIFQLIHGFWVKKEVTCGILVVQHVVLPENRISCKIAAKSQLKNWPSQALAYFQW